MVHIHVMDDSGPTTFVFFDRVISQDFGNNAKKLMESVMNLSILFFVFFFYFLCYSIKTINIGFNCILIIQIKNRERPQMIIQLSLTPYVTRICFSNWKSIKKNVELRFYTYAVKKMSDDNEIIDDFKKKYHIECYAAPHNGRKMMLSISWVILLPKLMKI